MGRYLSILAVLVSVCHVLQLEQTYLRLRLQESNCHQRHRQDITALLACVQTWRLKLSHTKMVTAVFYLNNQEVFNELKVYNSNRILLFFSTSTYLGIKLNRLLTFCHHLVALCKKLSLYIILLRQLVGSGWGADAKTLFTAVLFLVY